MTMVHVAFLVAVTSLFAMTSRCDGRGVIDLTHQLKHGENIGWPIYPDYNFTILTRGYNTQFKGWVEFNRFEMVEHMGTHMDAPAHTSQGKWRMHQIPVDHFVGPGVVVDIRPQVKKQSDYKITVQDLQNWEAENGQIPAGAIVLMQSGWAKRYPDKKQVFGTDTPLDPNTYNFPSMTIEAATWLTDNREIFAVGVDTPSPDLGRNDELPVHFQLQKHEIMILENVANTDSLPANGTTIVMGALKLYDASGSPMRIFALEDFGNVGSDGGLPLRASIMSLVFVPVLALLFPVINIE